MSDRCRVKICGITDAENAQIVCDTGADAIGFVFHASSPRNITAENAAKIMASLPPFIQRVGLFCNASAEAVYQTLAACPLDLLQFHGTESAQFCIQFPRPYIKAIGLKGQSPETALKKAENQHPLAQALLIDSHAPGEEGGTGHTMDWATIPLNTQKPIILAGGLTPENVGEAIKTTHIYACDVSSGVESKRGQKMAIKFALLCKRYTPQIDLTG